MDPIQFEDLKKELLEIKSVLRHYVRKEYTEYKIIKSKTLVELEEQIYSWLRSNWDLVGGVKIVSDNSGSLIFFQTLAKDS